MKKWNGIDIRPAIGIAFIVAMILWGRYGNLKHLIRLHAETALPLALVIFGLYSLIRLKNRTEMIKWGIPFAVIVSIVLWYRYGNPYSILPYPADTSLLFALFFLGVYALWQIRNKRVALSLIALVLLSVSCLFYFDVIDLQEKRFFLAYPIMAMLIVWAFAQAVQKKEQEN